MRQLKCYGPKCDIQGIKHPREELTEFHHKNYCLQCYPIVKRSWERRQRLIDFIIEKYHVPSPSPQMLGQIKSFVQDRHYTYKGIENSLIFMHDVKHKEYDQKYGLGYIPYVYDNAQVWNDAKAVTRNIVQDNVEDLPETAVMSLRNKASNVGLIDEEGLLD